MKLFDKKGIHWVDFRAPDGRRYRKSTGVKIEAKGASKPKAFEVAGKIVQQFMAAGDAPPQPVSIEMTLGEMLQRQLDQHWAGMEYGKTMKHTVAMLKREIGDLTASQVTYKTLKEFCERRRTEDDIGNGTLNRWMDAVALSMREAQRLGDIKTIPDSFPRYTEKAIAIERYMLPSEEAELLAYFDRMATEDELKCRANWVYMKHLTVFLIDTGFRFSEAFKFTLTEDSADLKHGVTKTTIGRRVPLTTRAMEAVKFLLSSELHKELDRQTTKARPKVSWDWCNHRFERAMLETGINKPGMKRTDQKITMHTLRHTCASRLVQRGIDIFKVQKWMGHRNIKTTMRYAKLAPDSFAGALAALEGKPIGLSLVGKDEVKETAAIYEVPNGRKTAG